MIAVAERCAVRRPFREDGDGRRVACHGVSEGGSRQVKVVTATDRAPRTVERGRRRDRAGGRGARRRRGDPGARRSAATGSPGRRAPGRGGRRRGHRRPADTLVEVLGRAIERVTDGTATPATPPTRAARRPAMAAVRVVDGRLDLLVLATSPVVVDVVGGPPLVATDRREVDIVATVLPALEAAEAAGDAAGQQRLLGALRSRRNSPGGFWVAKDDPAAAQESVTGSRRSRACGRSSC